jgi:hypothetical protein
VPAKDNLAAIKNSFNQVKKKNFETYEFEGMNHLFQECKTELSLNMEKLNKPFRLKYLIK